MEEELVNLFVLLLIKQMKEISLACSIYSGRHSNHFEKILRKKNYAVKGRTF